MTTSACLALGFGLLFFAGVARAMQDDAQAIQPPQVLIDAGLLSSQEEPSADAKLPWAEILKAVEPEPWPEVVPKPAGILPAEAANLIKQARSAAAKGEAYRAVKLLKQAEQLAPDHPKVARALGLAYADTGNLMRAAMYLRNVAAAQREDTEVLLVLAKHAAQAGRLEQVLTYTDALRQAKAPSSVVDYYLAAGADRQGYTTAAADRLSSAVMSLKDQDQANANKALDATLRVELDVLKATLAQLQIEMGDLRLRAGDRAAAAKAYAEAKVDDPAARQALIARRVYLALLSKNQNEAIDQAVTLLSFEDVSDSDARLVAYLLEQGVPANALAQRIDRLVEQDGATRTRLLALSQVAEKGVLLTRIEAWLDAEAVTPDRLMQAVGLFQFDDRVPADAEPLAAFLELVSEAIQQDPDQALAHARAVVGSVDAPVTLLRAIRTDAFKAEQDWSHRLVSAVAYETTGRRRDAMLAFRALLTADEPLASRVLLPVVRLQLDLGDYEEAHALLGEPDLDADWQTIELSLRAMAAAGKTNDALTIVDRYIKANGKKLSSDVLRIELIAQMGHPSEACNLLLRLITSNANDESLYRLGIALAYDYRVYFSRPTDAERMSRAFLTRLLSNLPDSTLARIGMAQSIMSNSVRRGEAEQLLNQVLEEEPDNASALSMLAELYTAAGDAAAAAAMHERYVQALAPGLSKTLVIAERAIALGQMQRAAEVLERAIQLDEQGVLPGSAMTGDQASSVLRRLEATDPDRNTDALYLAMVRRFPDHPGLNNALGYRWSVEDKNLLQAKTMIERALDGDPTSHSILDSLAWVQYKLGQFDDAKVTQGRALMILEVLLARMNRVDLTDDERRELAATTAILNDHMGDIQYKLGDAKTALEHWRTATKQEYGEEQMRFDPELRTLADRLKAKIDAMADERPVPVAEVPGKAAHGPEGHPADMDPADPAEGG
jgi:predicted Zn-dependent protease